MKLCIFTIVLDGMPWIEKHLPIFQQLKCDWEWIVVHGAAMNNGSTAWCQPQEPRLSNDGTGKYLRGIAIEDGRITLLEHPRWDSKDQMINTAINEIEEPCVLMEIDSDEVWTATQLDKIVQAFEDNPSLDAMQFACNYYVGKDLVTHGQHCYGDMDYEWWRAWRFTPGMRFVSHEPPKFNNEPREVMLKRETQDLIGRFNHFAYATEAQVAYKEKFYGYRGLTEWWRALQNCHEFPVPLSRYFGHVKGDLPLVVKI